MYEPLGSFLRPNNLEEFVGQTKLVGTNGTIRVFLENKKIPSMLFWGPPGCGKTSLANIIAHSIKAEFYCLSGVTSKKDDLKEIIIKAEYNYKINLTSIVFLDEIHRWNKAQQDTLLPYVEKGIITLIGATTENPSFAVISPLLSRCRVFVFDALDTLDIFQFLQRNIQKIYSRFEKIKFTTAILEIIAKFGNGDLRNTLNLIETIGMLKKEGEVVIEDITIAGEKIIYYDKNQDEHYNIISAIHKSLRDSDADAACYWIQRMLVAGEDPLYIARRLLRFASEDIGIANNNALLLANQVYEAIQKVGMPESDVFLLHLAIYLAQSPKNNSAYMISLETKKDIHTYGNLPVPLHLRNASTKLMQELGYAKGYKYAHDYKDTKVDQEHFPDKLKGKKYLIH